MASIYDQLEVEARGGPRLQPTPANPVSRAVRSAVARVSDAVAASPAGAQQIENSLLDAGQFLSGLFAPGGAKGAGLVLSPRNIPKLQEAMAAYWRQNPNAPITPAHKALAYARAKYPRLTRLADIHIGKIPDNTSDSTGFQILGKYHAASNTAQIHSGPIAWAKKTPMPESRQTRELVDTIMHEVTHARQHYGNRPPPRVLNEATGELKIPDVAQLRAKKTYWDYQDYENQADYLASRIDPSMSIVKDDLRLNLYARHNPYEAQAYRAGDTANKTYQKYRDMATRQYTPDPHDVVERAVPQSNQSFVQAWVRKLFGGR